MPGGPIAGRIWSGQLRATAPITPEQDFEFICGVVQEAIYFDFYGEQPDHGKVDLTVGLCDDPVEEGVVAVLLFPAVVTTSDPSISVDGVLSLAAGLVREVIDSWYEQPTWFEVSFLRVDRTRVRRP